MAEPVEAGDHFADHREDERDGEAEPQAGENIGAAEGSDILAAPASA